MLEIMLRLFGGPAQPSMADVLVLGDEVTSLQLELDKYVHFNIDFALDKLKMRRADRSHKLYRRLII